MAIIKMDDGESIDLTRLDKNELMAIKSQLTDKSMSISISLDRARADYHITGIRADPDWYHRATAAKKITGGHLRAVDGELSRRRQGLTKRKKPFSRYFLEAARAVLTEDALSGVYEYAEQLMEQEEETASPEGTNQTINNVD